MQTRSDIKGRITLFGEPLQTGSLFVLFLVALMFALAYRSILLPRKDFYNELWAPAFLLVHGHSPYDTQSLNPKLPAAWLPMAIGFFSPLGWLAEQAAMQVWYFFNIIEMGVMLLIFQRGSRSGYNLIAMALFVFLFPITLAHLILGQFALTTCLCAIAAILCIQKERHWLAAFLLALACSKPQLMTLPMIGLCIYYYKNGGYRSMAYFGARFLVMSFALCLPLFIAHANWLPDAVNSFKANPYWSYPTMYTVFFYFFGNWGVILWPALCILVLWATIWLWNNFSLDFAAYWSLALALLVTPYAGPWDFVTLLPVFLYAFSGASLRRKLFLVVCYFISWCGELYVQYSEGTHSFSFWWVPLIMMAFTALGTDWKAERERGGLPAPQTVPVAA